MSTQSTRQQNVSKIVEKFDTYRQTAEAIDLIPVVNASEFLGTCFGNGASFYRLVQLSDRPPICKTVHCHLQQFPRERLVQQ